MKGKVLEIFNHFGLKNQRRKFNEECLELLDELNSAIFDKEKIIDELADVNLLLKQFQFALDISNDELKQRTEFKVDRTLKRIESKYYK